MSSLVRLALVLGVLEGFGPLSMDVYMPQLPQLAASLDTTDALAQATMSVCMIGLGLGQLIAGPLSDRHGRRRPLIVSIIAFTLLSAACALAPTIEFLLVVRFLQGLAGAAGMVISLSVARDLFAGVDLSKMLSLLAIVTATTPIIAPILGGQLARVMDWRGIFWVLALIGAALVFVAAFALPETHPAAARVQGQTFRATRINAAEVVRDPVFRWLLVSMGCGGIAFFSYLSMSSFVVQNEFGFDPQIFSLIFAINALCQLGGAQVSRFLVSRLGVRRLYMSAQVVGALMGISLCLATVLDIPAIGYLALLALFLGTTGINMPNGNALALAEHGSRAGTASALLGMATFSAGAIIVPGVSALLGSTSLAMAATIAVAASCAAVVAMTGVRRALAVKEESSPSAAQQRSIPLENDEQPDRDPRSCSE